jgi:hypothetical protein
VAPRASRRSDSSSDWAEIFDLAQQAGAKDPKTLAKQLVVLYDGAGISAWMDHDPSAETAARTVAAALVDAAIPSR